MAQNIRWFQEIGKGDAPVAGGKGASLGEMTRAGIPVPSGFVVLASVFDRVLEEAGLLSDIERELALVREEDAASVDRASDAIREHLLAVSIPVEVERDIRAAFGELGAEFVAVRSSATAEDSSDASWAGELESYLNTTEACLLENVKRCWASLFTSRAIVYRREKGMEKTRVSVAVVVQKMVQSEVAGIAFTVHPVTKDPNQMIIEACWGLGEMIVGGQVTPDAYVVDKRDGTLLDLTVSEQEEMLVRTEEGNVKNLVPEEKRSRQKLSGSQIREISDLCLRIERHYGFPCDIEWAMEGNAFSIVQSRPITTL